MKYKPGRNKKPTPRKGFPHSFGVKTDDKTIAYNF